MAATCASTILKRAATVLAVVLQKNVLFSGTIKENLRWGDPNATDAEQKQRLQYRAGAAEKADFFDSRRFDLTVDTAKPTRNRAALCAGSGRRSSSLPAHFTPSRTLI